ncbi:hypothetical protein BH11ACT8_BH11ACT8_19110 [soil metagenome]
MSRHRAEPPPRYRPRYGRIAVLFVSVATTGVGLLGGLGVLPSAADDSSRGARASLADTALDPVGTQRTTPAEDPTVESTDDPSGDVSTSPDVTAVEPGPSLTDSADPGSSADVPSDEPAALPAGSGTGRRAVFSQSQQRVWLVSGGDHVKRTYLVSGSVTDNLDPGTYEVFSRSEDAYGIDDSGTMKWFVRFTRGPTGAAIGFHSIPVDEGLPLQTKGQLGTPQSHGCIRQKTVDAKAMWAFAQLGDTVVVTA